MSQSTEHAAFDEGEAESFLAASAAWPPRDSLIAAADRLDRLTSEAGSSHRPMPRRAVDLGCGAGTETLELLRRGWRVHAIDAHRSCLEFVRRRADEAGVAAGLTLECCRFETLALPPRTYALAHAGFSLPFCRAEAFGRLWRQVTEAVLPQGCFAGQFFGAREPLILDAPPGSVTAHSAESIGRLLGESSEARWNAVRIEEVDRPGRGPCGEPKHWHLFHVLLERRSAPPARDDDGGADPARTR